MFLLLKYQLLNSLRSTEATGAGSLPGVWFLDLIKPAVLYAVPATLLSYASLDQIGSDYKKQARLKERVVEKVVWGCNRGEK